MIRPFRLILLGLLLTTAMPFSMAQRILGGISLGMNLCQVDGDEYYGFNKVGLNVGPMVSVPFGTKKQWSVSMELLYSQKGSYHYGDTDSTTFRLNLDYAEIPIVLQYTDKQLISGVLGFSYGRLINYKETKNNFYDSIYRYKTPLSNNEFAVIADLRIRVWNRLWANLRYQYTMKNFRTVEVNYTVPYQQPETRYQYNNVITLRVTWVFNQPPAERRKKETQGN